MCSLDLQMRVSIFEMLVASLGPSPYCAVDQGISYLKWWLWSTDRDKNPRIFSVLMKAKYFVGVFLVYCGESCFTWNSSYSSSHSLKCWSAFLPVQPTSTCLLCTLLGLTSCPGGFHSRRRLFPSKSVQQRGQDRVTRGVLVLKAGNKPCCLCPGVLSLSWPYIRHMCLADTLSSSTGAAVSAGQIGLVDHSGSVHVLQLWLSSAALGAQTDHCSIISQCRTLPSKFGVLQELPTPWWRAGRQIGEPREWCACAGGWVSGGKPWEEAGALH